MKTKEELNALKEEVETLNKKLAALTDGELEQVAGGDWPVISTAIRISDLRRFLNGKLDYSLINYLVEQYERFPWNEDGMRIFLDGLRKFNYIDQATCDGIMEILFAESY